MALPAALLNINSKSTDSPPLLPAEGHLRAPRFAAPNQGGRAADNRSLSKSAENRKQRDQELSTSIERRQRWQQKVLHILAKKREFQARFDNLQTRVDAHRSERLSRLSLAILKAYAEKQREQKKNFRVVSLVRRELKINKARRLFACLRSYADWQKQWLAQVRGNFARQKLKSTFRDIYLNAVLNRILLKRALAKASKVFKEIQYEARYISNIQARLLHQSRRRVAKRVVLRLHQNGKRRKYLREQGEKISMVRKAHLQRLALKFWRIFHCKTLEYRQDEITKKFVDRDNVVICSQDPALPLLVTTSDDSFQYFDVNAHKLYSVEAKGLYKEEKAEGHVVRQQERVRIDLDKYYKKP